MTNRAGDLLFTEGVLIEPDTLIPRFVQGAEAPETYSSPGGEPSWRGEQAATSA